VYTNCMTFVDWLDEERNKRNWSKQRLAEEAGVSHVMIHHIYKGTRKAGIKTLSGIAKALDDMPLDNVMNAYRGISDKTQGDDAIAEILKTLPGFTPVYKEDILEYVRMKRRIAEKNGTYSPND